MPGKSGRKVRRPKPDPNYYTRAGECKVTQADGSCSVIPALSPGELQRIVKVRADVKVGTRMHLYRRDKGKCRYCGVRVGSSDWEPDHVVPIALGGSNKVSNLVVACIPCNRRKGAQVWTPKPIR